MMIKFQLHLPQAECCVHIYWSFAKLAMNINNFIDFGNDKSKCRYFYIQFHVFLSYKSSIEIQCKNKFTTTAATSQQHYIYYERNSHLRFLQVRFTYRIKFIARSHEGSLSWELYKDLWRRRRVYKDLWKCIAYRRIVDIIVTVTTKPAVMKLVSWWQVMFIAI